MVSRIKAYLQNIRNRDVLLILIGFMLGALVVSPVAHSKTAEPDWWLWLDGFSQNFGTEMIGAVITFGLIEVLLRARQEREAKDRATAERKAELIRQMGSRVNMEALRAAEELHRNLWTVDGSLHGASLHHANLQNVSLPFANLRGANLALSNLRRASLGYANLIEANLDGAELEEAEFGGAHLEGASFVNASLRGAKGVSLDQLDQVDSLEAAILPDGTKLPFGKWHEAFLAWRDTADVDRDNNVIPASLKDDKDSVS